MANIFRSKDIYKRAPKIPSSEDPLRIVKGLYVVGDYKPPYYIGPCLHITDIKTNKATVVDYTTKSMSYEDHVVNLIGINADTSPLDIVYFSTKRYPSNPEPMLRIKSITTNKATISDV